MPAVYVLQGPDRGCTFPVARESCILGRHSDQFVLNDHTVSRRHALLERSGDTWRVRDLGSSNGTYVNGVRVGDPLPVKDGDQIKIGGTLLVFRHRPELQNYHQAAAAREMIDLNGSAEAVDSSILSAIQASEDSVILAAPETADAVHAWNVMYQLAEAIGTILSIPAFLETVTDIILQHLIVDRVFILLRPDGGGEMEPAVVRFRTKRRRKDAPISTSRTIVNHVIETKSGVLCTNAPSDARFAADPKADSLERLAPLSVLCVPLMGHDDVHGVIHLDCLMSRHTYTHEHLRLATAIGKVVGLAIENHRLSEARMHHERLAATGETVAYLSHHIRNILQGLRGGADIVQLGLKRGNLDAVRSGWDTVEHNLERILHLTTNMLTFSRDRVPRIDFAQLNPIVEDAVQLARRPADERGAMILMTLDDLPPVPVDPEGIHQAAYNLIINAVAACPRDEGRISVKTRFDQLHNAVAISITDNGSGIPPDEVKRIFLPFHSSKGQGGTGLGLAAAKKVVDELGGEITVTSKLDKGTRFVITLPAERTIISDLDKTHGPPR